MRSVPAEAIRTPRDLAPYLDHTVLAPGATLDDVRRACAEARAHRFAGVCVRADAVAEVRRALEGSGVLAIAVVDFPRGEASTEARVAEAREAARRGAEELDLVVRLPALLAGRHEEVLDDLRAVIGAVAVPVKVILETSRLTRDQKVVAAALARCAGAAYVKTSTGFAGGGATVEDVALLRSVVGEQVGVKASGGIRTAEAARAMLAAGASRIGASASVALVSGAFP
ncbi:deoxyribose-phosphate aldolase [Anaeromyxobacter sp. PSR-1]|uniref:deoxyribose-phosphate aldolase n=1 Tax=unclassified Anaeromyxobacter TaxID=2620896 RepID=UPI0005E6E349|nr:deoxyribose-phosphate aldolase [Anaeromyxobacter sp. PSR-1]GAO05065.1 deoxyribose-phosphate aldolase [Anaeromyxobacter sp. PSR-1]